MNKKMIPLALIIALILLAQFSGLASNGSNVINKIKLIKSDIPDGFIYGKIPKFAKKVLKENPWEMDKDAIKKLAEKVYPGGDYSKISGMYVGILAKKDTPFGDDIVCYIILYRDSASAKGEIKKIREFAGFNGDRVIVETKNNLAVYLHVDDTKYFHLIEKINTKIKERLLNI
ncbi:MAG: hypothetical protein GY870_06235 [archaeon]|nr:hypothetical protein [archaeon]